MIVPRPELSQPAETRTDFVVFVALFVLTLLFELQLLVPELATFRVRHVLIAYLYVRQFVRARSWHGHFPPLLLGFLAMAALVALHSAWRYDVNLATAAFARFVNVAVLAPLAAMLVTTARQLRVLLWAWGSVVAAGFATALFQLAGGEMHWLVGDYYSARGEAGQVFRFKTILGDPNVGGMSAAIVGVGAAIMLRGVWRLVAISLAVGFITLSLSKAGAGLFILGLTLAGAITLSDGGRLGRRGVLAIIGALAMVVTVMISALLLSDTARTYAFTLLNSLVGTPGYGTDQSALDALTERVLSRTRDGFALAIAEVGNVWSAVLFGAGFGVAGSVAVEASGDIQAILPHNGYSEIFLVGGVVFLFSFIWIISCTLQSLNNRRVGDRPAAIDRALFVSFALLTLANLGFPVVYDPILGSLFWLIAGTALHRAGVTGIADAQELANQR